MSDDAPIHECESEIDHYTGHYVPTLYEEEKSATDLLHVQGLVRRGLQFIVLIRED